MIKKLAVDGNIRKGRRERYGTRRNWRRMRRRRRIKVEGKGNRRRRMKRNEKYATSEEKEEGNEG